MPRKARSRCETRIYHIILRGINRQELFHDEEDRWEYVYILQKYSKTYNLNILAWCLMSNHVHFLCKEGDESISTTIKRIGVSFVQYYHRKYQTNGHLFQDRFKSENVTTIDYVLTVVRYIHQNPLKANMVKTVEEWKWSSCEAYYSTSTFDFVNTDFILNLFSKDRAVAVQRFREFNERVNDDQCLEDIPQSVQKLTDEEAKFQFQEILKGLEIPHVKSLPRERKMEILRQVKRVEGVSQRQVARIFGVSQKLVWRA
ncbi:transposase [Bacillus coahuilensis p1.1.43]|uniref:Transposase n=1 Tax=Bacillus coahuilensis p1.1.43 TaxID=1150625 RepID=A0A147K4G1_9BACI|nr:transposase [Bacillus coahuilensis]KUP04255.1 transposase [Bacillus coahuilensis p1.1.43]